MSCFTCPVSINWHRHDWDHRSPGISETFLCMWYKLVYVVLMTICWVNRTCVLNFISSRFVPFTKKSYPHEPLLHTTSQFGHLPYGTKYFRHEYPESFISAEVGVCQWILDMKSHLFRKKHWKFGTLDLPPTKMDPRKYRF